ncbi:AraC family transcriptional regulator [Cohnella sp. WQ 127256]|uniref:AraC family transcriptional regulator n=1 Tax=Cohnella sp. WQ 127256 TaxID=2938790 RepID=UPI0021178C2D|nr:AraC family transcriptional regulator [Cohnella sp. WQ 127256]
MTTLALRTNLLSDERILPLAVYTTGMEQQPPINRVEGFSAHQLLITASGHGKVHWFDQNKWDIVSPNTVLYIPAGFPNKYVAENEGDWLVGFVSFHGSDAARESWALGNKPTIIPVQSTTRLLELLEDIWHSSGLNHDMWNSSELLFSLLTELRKQSYAELELLTNSRTAPETYRESVVLKASKFLQDYMHRNISISQLAEQVGYSQKQLTRLFVQTFQTTPLQYLRQVRMTAAEQLLVTHIEMNVSQIAQHVGMEPVYFTRIFHQIYGVAPSEYRKKRLSL